MENQVPIKIIVSLAWGWYFSVFFFKRTALIAIIINTILFANQFSRIKYNVSKKNWSQRVLSASFKLIKAVMSLSLMNKWLIWYSQWRKDFLWEYLSLKLNAVTIIWSKRQHWVTVVIGKNLEMSFSLYHPSVLVEWNWKGKETQRWVIFKIIKIIHSKI